MPAAAIFGEDEAHNTLDSLRAVAGELDRRGLRSAVLVSDPTHMYRVLRIATDLGLEAYGSPTRTSPVTGDLERWLAGDGPRAGCARRLLRDRQDVAGRASARLRAPHGERFP